MPAGDKKLRRAFKPFAVDAENPVGERRDGVEGFGGLLPVRRMADARQHQRLDRAIAFLLDDLHLRERAVRIGRALHDQHRHADLGERLGGVEILEPGIEPRTAPAAERRIDIGVMAREADTQVGRLVGRDGVADRLDV
jgi:hypothetical protein